MNASTSAAITAAETTPFVVIIVLELTGRGVGNKWATVYENYKDEDDIERHIDSDNRKQALKQNLRQYTEYSYEYTRSIHHLTISLFSIITILLSRKVRGTRWIEMLLISIFVLITLGYLVRRFFETNSPHNYDSKAFLRTTIPGWTVIITNILIIVVIVFT